jgi:hypothetical protein
VTRPDDVTIPSVEEAVAASKACALAAGLEVRSTEIIAAGYSVRVLLQPAGVVSRVVTEGRVLRGEPLPWLEREVRVARHLATAGAAVVPPAEMAGPYRSCGVDVTLWQWVPPQPLEVSPALFATILFDLHEHLASYAGDLPVLVGPLTDIRAALLLSDDATLHRAAARLVPEALEWPRRPLHGDAHTGNVLGTSGRPLWLDFEDACLGPVEWDLSSRTVTDEAARAYRGRIDAHLLSRCRQLRRLQILAAVLTSDVDPEGASLLSELRNALAIETA